MNDLRDPARREGAAEHLRNALQIAVMAVQTWYPESTQVKDMAAVRDRIQAALDIIEDVKRDATMQTPIAVRVAVLRRL